MSMNTAYLARSSGPITSFEAADAAKALIKTHERQIVWTLRLHGPAGVDRIAALADMAPHAVGKRVKALEDDGLIELTGKTVKSDSGRNQREWAATK